MSEITVRGYPRTVISLIKDCDGDEDAVYYDNTWTSYYIKGKLLHFLRNDYSTINKK